MNKKSPWAGIVIKAHLRPLFGGMRADQVTSGTIQRYIAKRQTEGKANGTINRELTMLRRAFRYATEVTPPKVGKVPRVPRLEEGPPRKGFFELAEYEAMLAALPDEIKPVLTFAFSTGCRKGMQQQQAYRNAIRKRIAEESCTKVGPDEAEKQKGTLVDASKLLN